MKHNKILGLLGIAAALTLVACGGAKDSGKTSKSGSGKVSTSKSSKPSTSKVPTKSVSVASANLVKKADNKVYVQVCTRNQSE